MILHDIHNIPKTPLMLAEEAGRRILSHVIEAAAYGRSVSRDHVNRAAMNCGRGELFVRGTKEFRAAQWLAA